MPRLISVALTVQQVRERRKTVTRRKGWRDVRPGDVLQPVEKAMGLKAGEKPVRVGGPVRVVKVWRERLYRMPLSDLPLEGFDEAAGREPYFKLYLQAYGGNMNQLVTRIEWEYINDGGEA